GHAVSYPTPSVTFANGVASSASGFAIPNSQFTPYEAGTTSRTLTVTDSVASAVTGSVSLTVTPKAADTGGSLTLAGSASQVAGSANNLTVTALDQYGNTDTNYTGSHNLTFSGANNSPNVTHPTVTNSSGTAI